MDDLNKNAKTKASIFGKIIASIVFIQMLAFLGACRPMDGEIINNLDNTGTAIMVSPSETKEIQKTITIPQSYSTATEFPSSTITPQPTLLPLPTLEDNEKISAVEDLYINHPDCKLPCWGNVTPGETKWEDAKRIFSAYAFRITEQPGRSIDHATVSLKTSDKEIWGSYRYIDNNYFILDGMIDGIEIFIPYYMKEYRISAIMEEYGMPDSAVVWTFPYDVSDVRMYMMYQSLGIWVTISVEGKQVEEGVVQGCFYEAVPYIIYVWDPVKEETYQSIDDRLTNIDAAADYYIEDYSDYTVERFYDEIIEGDSQVCIELLQSSFIRSK